MFNRWSFYVLVRLWVVHFKDGPGAMFLHLGFVIDFGFELCFWSVVVVWSLAWAVGELLLALVWVVALGWLWATTLGCCTGMVYWSHCH
ncbi:hypothetical protein U1Q18_007929 [Sarracenia purpurea var. burkii]